MNDLEQLEIEINHIIESGANSIRLMELIDKYARAKWDQASEAYEKALMDHYCTKKDYAFHHDSTAHFVMMAPKPEFKP